MPPGVPTIFGWLMPFVRRRHRRCLWQQKQTLGVGGWFARRSQIQTADASRHSTEFGLESKKKKKKKLPREQHEDSWHAGDWLEVS